MKFGIQLNPQVSIEKNQNALLTTLVEQVRVADSVGFGAVSMGQHYNIPGYQRLHQVPLLARLCAELRHCSIGNEVNDSISYFIDDGPDYLLLRDKLSAYNRVLEVYIRVIPRICMTEGCLRDSS